jgi:hypothetical protein
MHLSAEQGVRAARFLGLRPLEARYMRLLIEYARAGTDELRKMLAEELEELREQMNDFGQRVGADPKIAEDVERTYYSSWHYAVVHVMLTVPRLRTKERLAAALDLSEPRVAEVLSFLVAAGLATELDGGSYGVGSVRMHARAHSPEAVRHHANLRTLSLATLQDPEESDLYFSAVISLSAADQALVRQRLVDAVERIQIDLQPSPSEEVLFLNIDLYRFRT